MADSQFAAWVEVLPDFSSFRRTASSEMTDVLGTAGTAGGLVAGQNMSGGILSGIKGLGAPILGAIAALGIGRLVGDAIGTGIQYGLDGINLAAGLAEQKNAVAVAFGAISDEIIALGKVAPKNLNLTQTAFAQLAVRFSSFAKTIAGDGGNVATVINDLTQRGADFASVYDIEASEALELFQSGLAGETEPLRKFGVDLSAASVEAFALASGINDGTHELTEAEKVQARYGSLLAQTAIVQGDLANTAGSYANQQREFAVALEEAQTKFGEALLPVATDILGWANETFLPSLQPVLDEIGPELATSLTDAAPQIKEALTNALEVAPEALSFLTDQVVASLNDVADAAAFAEDPMSFFIFKNTDGTEFTGLRDALVGLGKGLEEAGTQFTDIITNVNTQKDPFDAAVVNFFQDAIAATTALPGIFEVAGGNAAKGFAQGIRNNKGHAVYEARAMADEVVSIVQTAREVASPSKVFQRSGAFTAEGFALGISGGAAGVSAAVSSMLDIPTGVSVDGLSSSAVGASGSGVRDVYFQGTDPAVVFAQFKQEIGGELAIR